MDSSCNELKVREVKIVLLGDCGVGKSSLVLRFVNNQYKPFSESTIGASFLNKSLTLDDTIYKFQIWDTAGQEKYHSLAGMYYRGAAASIVVYDITRMSTFQTLKMWIKELKTTLSHNIIIIVAGNKCDLNQKREVDTDMAKAYTEEIGGYFFECSAKGNMNVGSIFREIPLHLLPLDSSTNSSKDEVILGNNNLMNPSNSTSSCC